MGNQNTLSQLNDHLFTQLKRLSQSELKGDELKEEVSRTKAVVSVAGQIISNGRLVLEAQTEFGQTNQSNNLKMLAVDEQ